MASTLAENLKTQASRIPLDARMRYSSELLGVCAALSAASAVCEVDEHRQGVVYLIDAVEGLLTLMKREGLLEERP